MGGIPERASYEKMWKDKNEQKAEKEKGLCVFSPHMSVAGRM